MHGNEVVGGDSVVGNEIVKRLAGRHFIARLKVAVLSDRIVPPY